VYQPSSLAAVESMVKTWIDPPTDDRARKRRIGPPLGERRVVELATEHLFSWIATDLRGRSLKYIRNVVDAEEDRPTSTASASSDVIATAATAGVGGVTPLALDFVTTGVPLQKVAEPIEPDYGADEDEDIVDDVDEDEVEGETDS